MEDASHHHSSAINCEKALRFVDNVQTHELKRTKNYKSKRSIPVSSRADSGWKMSALILGTHHIHTVHRLLNALRVYDLQKQY